MKKRNTNSTVTGVTGVTSKRGSKSPAIIKVATEHPELSVREIGRLCDCTHSNVVQVLKRYGIDHTGMEQFRANRADILAGMQQRFLASLTDADIQKTPAIQRITATGILYDKERLERGHGDSAPRIQINIVADPSKVVVQSAPISDDDKS